MANTPSDDVLLPAPAGATSRRVSAAAFVPIAVAMAGVAAILLGGVSARDVVASADPVIDPVVTGSIHTPPASEADHVQRWE